MLVVVIETGAVCCMEDGDFLVPRGAALVNGLTTAFSPLPVRESIEPGSKFSFPPPLPITWCDTLGCDGARGLRALRFVAEAIL